MIFGQVQRQKCGCGVFGFVEITNCGQQGPKRGHTPSRTWGWLDTALGLGAHRCGLQGLGSRKTGLLQVLLAGGHRISLPHRMCVGGCGPDRRWGAAGSWKGILMIGGALVPVNSAR